MKRKKVKDCFVKFICSMSLLLGRNIKCASYSWFQAKKRGKPYGQLLTLLQPYLHNLHLVILITFLAPNYPST